MKKLFKYGLAVIRQNKLLLLREEEQDKLILPGGRKENGETARECLKREIKEELNADLNGKSLKYFGTFEDEAAGKPNTRIRLELYLGGIKNKMKPANEIKEIVWFDRNDDWNKLSPALKNKILPALISKGLIS